MISDLEELLEMQEQFPWDSCVAYIVTENPLFPFHQQRPIYKSNSNAGASEGFELTRQDDGRAL
jgi:hypothetical protein